MTGSLLLDRIDRAILETLQDSFPLTEHPWAEIAARIGIAEDDLLARLGRLQDEKIVRGISPVIESRSVGLNAATLVALHVPEERIEEVAAIINNYPQVSHNFRREHHYSLWFTLSEGNEEELHILLSGILEKTGIADGDALNLPTVRKFKVDVRFPFALPGGDG